MCNNLSLSLEISSLFLLSCFSSGSSVSLFSGLFSLSDSAQRLLSPSLSSSTTTSGGSWGASLRSRSCWHFHPLLVIKKTVFLSLQGAGQTQPPPNKKISGLSKAISLSRVFLECSALESRPRSPPCSAIGEKERERKRLFLKWFKVRESLIDGCYLSVQRDIRWGKGWER